MPKIRGNAAMLASKKILSKIANYDLVSGDVISDLELSKEFEMSRTPVREAVMSLIDNGILERNNSKVVIKPITLSDITEILQVREAIEQKSVEIIITNGGLSNTNKKELQKIHKNLCENIANGHFNSNFDADDLFHKKIIEFSNNSRFLNTHDRVSLQTQRLRWISLLTPARYAKTREEHSDIIENLLKNDIICTKEAIHVHMKNTLQNYEQILNMPQWNKIADEIKNMNI